MSDGGSISRRVVLIAATLVLAATACSIQAPDFQLVSQGGGAGPGVLPSGVATGAGGSYAGGQFGGGTVGGGGPAASGNCVGKATDTGVTGSTIKLGSTFAISGPVSSISGPIKKGVLAYFNEVNATGGIYGRKIDLKYYDDGWDAQKGKGLIKKLVEQDKVFALTTVPSSNGLDAATSYLESKRMPVFGSSGLIESQFRSPMIWPIGTGTRSASRIGESDIVNRLGAKNVAVVWLDLLSGAEARDAYEKALPKRMLAADRRVGLSEAEFSPVWADVKKQTRDWQKAHGKTQDGIPDFVALLIDPTNAVKALEAAQNLGFKPRIGWGGGAPLFLDLVLGSTSYAADTGIYAQTSFIPPLPEFAANPAVQAYIRTVHKYYPNADLLNPYLEGGYAGAALTVEIFKRAGSCLTREKAIEVANSIAGYSAAGLTQPLTYKQLGVGQSHYGNLFILGVQAVKDSKHGHWKVAVQGSQMWAKDPSPGA
ncbi:MAG: ABC transporter substrate-binding protein [Actinomycetota bacterium]|nr:ABC transporter substrate-binding protein [Actinomycetota bacterium]